MFLKVSKTGKSAYKIELEIAYAPQTPITDAIMNIVRVTVMSIFRRTNNFWHLALIIILRISMELIINLLTFDHIEVLIKVKVELQHYMQFIFGN